MVNRAVSRACFRFLQNRADHCNRRYISGAFGAVVHNALTLKKTQAQACRPISRIGAKNKRQITQSDKFHKMQTPPAEKGRRSFLNS